MNYLPETAPRQAEGALGPYVRAIRAHRVLVVVVTMLTIAAGVAYLTLRPLDYQATAQLLVTPLPQDDQTFLGLQMIRDSGDPTRTVQTAATLVESTQAASATARKLGPSWNYRKVLNALEVKPEGGSNILAITATADEPGLSARIANTFARQALKSRTAALRIQARSQLVRLRAHQDTIKDPNSDEAGQVADQITQLQSVEQGTDPTLALSQQATVPNSPAGTPTPIVLILAAIAGFTLASGGALLLELLDRRMRDLEEAVALYPLPILARVPRLSKRQRQQPRGAPWLIAPGVREAFRTVLAQLRSEDEPDKSRVVMVTSASTGDGKTTSTINLAVSMAASGSKVVLLDFDLRKPDVANTLGMTETRQMVELLKMNGDLSHLLLPAPHLPSLSVLATSAREGDLALVESLHQRLPDLIRAAREAADVVVIDTAPLGEVSDALRIIELVDEIVIVNRPGNTNRSSFMTMRDLLERAGRVPAGLVVIGETDTVNSPYYSYGMTERGMFSRSRGGGILPRIRSPR